jgi:predicted transcriptional regulator
MMQQFKLRLPEKLKAQLEESAKESGNSLNSEIIWRLGQSFQMDKMREGLREVERERAATQQRCNQLHDVLLQLLSKDLVLVRKDQVK